MAAGNRYAVVWVPETDFLAAHDPAGIAGVVVAEFPYDQRGIQSTGRTTALGSSIWVEVLTESGETGWVKTWNVTADVPQEEFCSDPRVADLILRFADAIENENGAQLAQISNPDRGLVIRHDWWNPDVVISPSGIPALFGDESQVEWGVMSGGEFPISGSFKDVILPGIQESIGVSGWVCNNLPTGATSREALWPGELASMNYMAHYAPPGGGNQFNWRTLALGFEYVDGLPYLALIMLYRGDV
jgi:hypothetical protein